MQSKSAAIQPLASRFLLFALLPVLAALTLGFATRPAGAAQATLEWAAPANTAVAGYKIYYGTASRSYTQSVDVGNLTSYTLSNLSDGRTYYFALMGYDSSGNKSGYSNEMSKTFASTYSITATSGSGGTVTPSGAASSSTASSGTTTITTVSVAQGGSASFSIAPAAGYAIAGVTVDGSSVGAVSSYTFSNVTASHAISATFVARSFTISASAGAGGSITPSGTTTVNSGSSQGYTITPATGYKVASVTVDGAPVGALSSYTFSNVGANHTIAATFAATFVSSAVLTSTTSFQNLAFPSQYGSFTASFDAVPSANYIDAVTSLAGVPVRYYSDCAAGIRFNKSGTIDARNGGGYAAGVAVPYQGGRSYHFRMVVNVTTRTYDVYVTPSGGSEIMLATRYPFRTEQASATVLNNLAVIAPAGSHKVLNFRM